MWVVLVVMYAWFLIEQVRVGGFIGNMCLYGFTHMLFHVVSIRWTQPPTCLGVLV